MYTHILYLNACAGLQPPRDRKRANQAVRVGRGHGARGVRGRSSVRLGTPCAESNKRRQQRRGTFPLLHTPRTCCVLRRMLPARKCLSQHARGTSGSGRSLARPLFTESPGHRACNLLEFHLARGLLLESRLARPNLLESRLARAILPESRFARLAKRKTSRFSLAKRNSVYAALAKRKTSRFSLARRDSGRRLPRQTQKRQKLSGWLVTSLVVKQKIVKKDA
jgi:hypothetical protein